MTSSINTLRYINASDIMKHFGLDGYDQEAFLSYCEEWIKIGGSDSGNLVTLAGNNQFGEELTEFIINCRLDLGDYNERNAEKKKLIARFWDLVPGDVYINMEA